VVFYETPAGAKLCVRYCGSNRLLKAPRLAMPLVALAAALTPVATTEAEALPCPNERARQESNVNPETGQSYSMQLPDCRAYELVSPSETGGAAVPVAPDFESTSFGAGLKRVLVTEDGSVFFDSTATPSGTGAVERGGYLDVFRSRRTGSGWTTQDMTAFGTAPGDVVLKQASRDGSRLLVETPLTLNTGDLDNPANYIDRGMDLYLITAAAPPQLVTRGELPNATPGQNATDRGVPFANAELSAVGFNSIVSLQSLEGGAANSIGCYVWADVESRLAYLTNPVGSNPSNCKFLAMAPDGRAIIEDTSGDLRSGRIFASAGASEFTSAYTVQLSGDTEHAAKFDAISPDGGVAYITSTDQLDHTYETEGKASLYAVSMATGAFAGGAPSASCISCRGGSNNESVKYMGQSADGSYVYFSTNQGLWSWNTRTAEPTLLSTMTNISEVVPSQNGQFAIGVSARSAANALYEFFSDGAPPVLVAPATSSARYVLVGTRGGEAFPVAGVADSGQRAVYEAESAPGSPWIILEWTSGETGGTGEVAEISPLGTPYTDELLGTYGGDLESVFFEAHQPLVPVDHNAGTSDIYDAHSGGGFPTPTEPGNSSRTPNPVAPSSTPFTPNLTTPSRGLPGLPPDTSRPAATSKPKAVTRTQKLAQALKGCKQQRKRKRTACEGQAQKRYGAKGKTKKTAKVAN
jgi:hypothetical protein